MRRPLAAVATLLVMLAAPIPAQTTAELDQFLIPRFGAKAADVAAVSTGEAYAALLPASVDREIVTAGAVRIAAPAAATVQLIRDISRLESGKGFRHTQRLSTPPVIGDFAALRVSGEDAAALRKCRPGDCSFKLTKEDLALVAQLDWSRPDVIAQLNQLARRAALDYVNAYRRGGNRELAVYADRDRPMFLAAEFADMVRRTRLLPGELPELSKVLFDSPANPAGGAFEDFYYWSEAEFGLKPVVRINHVVIQTFPPEWSLRYAIATKQIYANHYFHTALEVRALIDEGADRGRGHYLLVLNMARSDGLTGVFGALVKAKARAAARDGLKKALAATRRRVEAGRASPPR